MSKIRFKKPSPALVIAVIALFVGLSGAAYAGNKIGTNQIKGKAVTTGKLAGKAVTNGKLAGQAVKSGKLADGAVTSSKLSDESVKSDELGEITKVEESSPPAAVPQINATADCPAGTKVMSGGFKVTSATNPDDPPIPTGDKRSNNGWEARAVAQNPGDTVTAYAYCLEESS
jgi:hypothetical protein